MALPLQAGAAKPDHAGGPKTTTSDDDATTSDGGGSKKGGPRAKETSTTESSTTASSSAESSTTTTDSSATTTTTTSSSTTSSSTTTTEPSTTTTTTTTSAPSATGSAGSLWIDAETLAALPMSGPAWDRLWDRANSDIGTADIADQDTQHDTDVMAVALVAARTGDPGLRAKAVAEVLEVIGTDDNHDPNCSYEPNRARSMSIGRSLIGYVVAADLVGLRPGSDGGAGDTFAAWVDMVRHKENCPNTGSGTAPDGDWFDLSQTHDAATSNGNALAGASRIAAALYLGDGDEVSAAWTTYRRYAGDTSVGSPLYVNAAGLLWSLDPTAGVGINPAGAVVEGIDADGAIVADQGRGGLPTWPPGYTQYPWEGLQGLYAQAQLLTQAGYPAWDVSDQAPLRAIEYQWRLYEATGDARWWDRMDWVKYMANSVYGANLEIWGPGDRGRNMAWTDWTHA